MGLLFTYLDSPPNLNFLGVPPGVSWLDLISTRLPSKGPLSASLRVYSHSSIVSLDGAMALIPLVDLPMQQAPSFGREESRRSRLGD
jgi:hypothetical protein